ncbi:putative methyltransferase/nucleic acid-binding protein [Paratrimastix pyriformis]|uniref:tRNA (guanine(10)-N(2))-methyltransferase n=1 Tax=Paratrimastix pyriformis TaxID=342808 RepID=A0ABQ8UIU2_9EUKA|nr:putative methyltransferase/nucleic acid-binding protein [Paratrimastix pyriformis]
MRFLAYFYQELLNFRLPELHSLAEMFHIPISHDPTGPEDEMKPFLWVELPDEEAARKIASRSILLKAFIDVWAFAPTLDALNAQLRSLPAEDFEHRVSPHVNSEGSFRVEVDGYGTGLPFGIPFEKRPAALFQPLFAALPVHGKCRLKNPDRIFWLVEDHGHPQTNKPTGYLDPPELVYYGREVARGPRDLVTRYDLRTRTYIGTTSMKAELSFLVANMAHARPGTLVLDPFAGTGSIILSCAAMGAHVMGSDLDIRCLRGTPDRNVLVNFRDHGLPPPDLFGCDQAHAPWRMMTAPFLDAIVCDPPYGIREGTRKVGPRNNARDKRRRVAKQQPGGSGATSPAPEEQQQPSPVPAPAEAAAEEQEQDESQTPHVSQQVHYPILEVLGDLLDFAARAVIPGGRLCYWLPTTIYYKPSDVPTHPSFTLLSNSEQPLTTKMSRRLITMVKTGPPALGPRLWRTMPAPALPLESPCPPTVARHELDSVADVRSFVFGPRIGPDGLPLAAASPEAAAPKTWFPRTKTQAELSRKRQKKQQKKAAKDAKRIERLRLAAAAAAPAPTAPPQAHPAPAQAPAAPIPTGEQPPAGQGN